MWILNLKEEKSGAGGTGQFTATRRDSWNTKGERCVLFRFSFELDRNRAEGREWKRDTQMQRNHEYRFHPCSILCELTPTSYITRVALCISCQVQYRPSKQLYTAGGDTRKALKILFEFYSIVHRMDRTQSPGKEWRRVNSYTLVYFDLP